MPLLHVVLCSVQICRDHCEVQVSGHTGGHCRRIRPQDKTAVGFGCNFISYIGVFFPQFLLYIYHHIMIVNKCYNWGLPNTFVHCYL